MLTMVLLIRKYSEAERFHAAHNSLSLSDLLPPPSQTSSTSLLLPDLFYTPPLLSLLHTPAFGPPLHTPSLQTSFTPPPLLHSSTPPFWTSSTHPLPSDLFYPPSPSTFLHIPPFSHSSPLGVNPSPTLIR